MSEENLSDKVHAKAAKIEKEGKPRDQAYAIAASMEDRGEIEEGSTMAQYAPDAMGDKSKTSGVAAPVDVKREGFYKEYREVVENATYDIYERVSPEQMIAVLAQDENAANRVQGAVNIQQAEKQILMQIITQAKSGGKSLSEEQQQMFFEFLMATAIEFGLHGANTAGEASHQFRTGERKTRYERRDAALKDMIYAHLYKYLRDPNGAGPSSLSAKWSQQAMNYGETGDLPNVVYNLREKDSSYAALHESWKKFIKS